ncbi:MAG TPA: helix-turn-helix domain-containing protein [Spongiibacteraceae bacterium]|jgi:AraC family transcriptional regulator|nr:helix-turn-helix domain-containing protein [Spongiibacteraceae bacterium]HUH37965.1 helix-turn-helix domain-containing protein [Spongiibacteraceae bacterium]
MSEPTAPISVRQAQTHPDLVVAAIALPGSHVELCDFPELHAETLRVVEEQSVLSLGLSSLSETAEGRFASAGVPRYTRYGSLSFRPAGVPFEARVSRGRYHTIRCRFESTAQWPTPLDPSTLSNAQLEACFDIHAPRIEDAMLRLAEELAARKPDSRALAQALVTGITIDLSRYLAEAGTHALQTGGGLAPKHLRRVFSRMDQPGAAPNIDELAALCGLSRYHFMRAFKQSVGESPAAYARRLLMTRARNLLTFSDKPVDDIARQLGYTSAAAFSTAFRRASGRSPSAWRACMHQ